MDSKDQNKTQAETEPTIEIDGKKYTITEYKELEEKAMKMAQSAKELIENSLFYADGTPVQCVLASRTIGGRGDAAIVQQEFTGQNIVATLSVTPSWCYGTETMDLDPNTIKLFSLSINSTFKF